MSPQIGSFQVCCVHCLFPGPRSLVWDAALAGLRTRAGAAAADLELVGAERAARRGEILATLCEAE